MVPPRPRKRKWIGSMCDLFSAGSAAQMLIAAVLGIVLGWVIKAAYGFDKTKAYDASACDAAGAAAHVYGADSGRRRHRWAAVRRLGRANSSYW